MTLGQSPVYQWAYVALNADITTSLTSPYVIQFDQISKPFLADIATNVEWDTDGFLLLTDHKYLVTVQLELEYTGGTNIPVTGQLRPSDNTTVLKSWITNRAQSVDQKVLTHFQCLITTTQFEVIKVYLTNTTNLSKIGSNSFAMIQMLV